MDTKPVLLDFFCGEGLASAGYAAAGFQVIGVDNKEMSRYPFEFMVDGLLFKRHRLFEANWNIRTPGPCRCAGRKTINVHGGGAARETRNADGSRNGHGNKASAAEARALFGVDWASQQGMNQGVPPVYTTWIGLQLRSIVTVA